MVDFLGVAKDLTVEYGSRQALAGVSFEIGAGVTALVGANGAGKTTLMSVIGGGRGPTSGSFALYGLAGTAHQQEALRARTALMPQVFKMPDRVRVRDFMEYVAWSRGVPRNQRGSAIARTLAQVGLEDRDREALGKLSGGMQRRVLLAQALLAAPDLLLLDEPTEGLDPENRARVRQLIRDQGTVGAVLVSSHLMDEVNDYADRLLILEAGRLIFSGSTSELLAQTGTRHGEEFGLEGAYLRLKASVQSGLSGATS